MRELSDKEIANISGGFYSDDMCLIGATIGFLSCVWLNSKRAQYNKPLISWGAMLKCTLITASECGAIGAIIDIANHFSQSKT